MRETFESALVFGYQVLIDLGFTDERGGARPSTTCAAATRSASTLQLSGGLDGRRAR